MTADLCANCGCPLGDHDPDTMLCFEHLNCPGHTEITEAEEHDGECDCVGCEITRMGWIEGVQA